MPLRLQRAETDIHRQFPAVPAQCDKLSAITHGTLLGPAEKVIPVLDVARAVTGWNQHLDRQTGYFIFSIANCCAAGLTRMTCPASSVSSEASAAASNSAWKLKLSSGWLKAGS